MKPYFFDLKKEDLKLKKFVPASGAASRMFKFLNEFLLDFDHEKETINAYINRKKDKNLPVFLAGIEKFPFYEAVKSKIKELYPGYYSLEGHEKSYLFIKTLLANQYFDIAPPNKSLSLSSRYLGKRLLKRISMFFLSSKFLESIGDLLADCPTVMMFAPKGFRNSCLVKY